MTDMRRGRLPQGAHADHSICTLSVCVAHCPPPPVARKLSNPSWKVIVSASHGQYLKPGSDEPGFFSHSGFLAQTGQLTSFRTMSGSPSAAGISNSICTARRSPDAARRAGGVNALLIRGPHAAIRSWSRICGAAQARCTASATRKLPWLRRGSGCGRELASPGRAPVVNPR